MKIYICPICGDKHMYIGLKHFTCSKCTHPINITECNCLEIEKKPFKICPLCNKEYEESITECIKCGFGYQIMDDIENIIKAEEDKQQKQEQQLEYELNNPCVPKCPTCQSPNIKKISGGAKMLGALGFGLFSKTARSQFECLNCGYKW